MRNEDPRFNLRSVVPNVHLPPPTSEIRALAVRAGPSATLMPSTPALHRHGRDHTDVSRGHHRQLRILFALFHGPQRWSARADLAVVQEYWRRHWRRLLEVVKRQGASVGSVDR